MASLGKSVRTKAALKYMERRERCLLASVYVHCGQRCLLTFAYNFSLPNCNLSASQIKLDNEHMATSPAHSAVLAKRYGEY